MKTQAHTRYKNKDGVVVPGVTTIINKANMDGKMERLIVWANKLGLQGKDSTKERDEGSAIGTLTHTLIMSDLKGVITDTSDYSKEQIDKAENSYIKWLEWQKGKDFKTLIIEQPLVSEMYQFGGTPDFLGYDDGELVLLDYKTGWVGKEAYLQTCAYRQLAIENKYPAADKIIILAIPRTEDEKFQEVTYTSFDNGWEYFLLLKRCYELDKLIK